MNLFKVFASGKRRMREEFMSAFLAWLLSPEMDHGLRFEFVKRFIGMIASLADESELENRLSLLLQADGFLNSIDSEEAKMLTVDIEYGNTRPLDIVLRLGEYVIAIENKIFEESASDATQLSAQYAELRETLDTLGDDEGNHPVIMVFLVPKRKDLSPKALEAEYANLQIKGIDKKVMVFWNDTGKTDGSVETIIRNMLVDEGRGEINPIHEYTKHTLKGLITFIEHNFEGYANPSRSSSGMPSRYDGFWSFEELVQNADVSDVYIGFTGGTAAMEKTPSEELLNYGDRDGTLFKLNKMTEVGDMKNWIPLNDFIVLFQRITVSL